MTSALTFDHAIIAIFDVEQSAADFQSLGFTTFFGGQHANGETQNHLIVFADGGYLELLAPTSPDLLTPERLASKQGFLRALQAGEGWAGFAFLSHDLAADSAAMQHRGLPVGDPADNSRRRPDGELLAWRGAILEDTMTPFFIEDKTPRVLRVPDHADKIAHANGVTGVAEIVIAVHDLEKSLTQYQAILGLEPEQARFKWNDFALSFVTAETDGVAEYLAQHGEVPYALKLRTSSESHAGLLDVTLAHGARLELIYRSVVL